MCNSIASGSLHFASVASLGGIHEEGSNVTVHIIRMGASRPYEDEDKEEWREEEQNDEDDEGDGRKEGGGRGGG